MARTSAEEVRIAARRSQVAALLLQGVTNQYDIAARLGLPKAAGQRMVSRDIAAITQEWRGRAALQLDEAKGKELARIDQVEAAAWVGWERSLQNAETTEAAVSGDRKSGKKVSKGQAGDPQFLRVVLDCVAQRRALLGLDAPKRTEVTGADGEAAAVNVSVSMEDFRKLPPDEKVRVLRREMGVA
jgi:hypothetical protein